MKKNKKNRFYFVIVTKVVLALISVVAYYLIFSNYLDTPIEKELKDTNVSLKKQLEILKADIAIADSAYKNVSRRDKNIYKQLFNIDIAPTEQLSQQITVEENYSDLTIDELLAAFKDKVEIFVPEVTLGTKEIDTLHSLLVGMHSSFKSIPSIQPVDNVNYDKSVVSSGTKLNPFYKGYELHRGFDYVIEEGTRVFATADGRISQCGLRVTDKGGITIEINHQNGYKTRYSHLSKLRVKRGESVKKGDIIGYSGNTGYSFVPHLHYEVLYNDQYIAPSDFFFADLSKIDYYTLKTRLNETIQSCD